MLEVNKETFEPLIGIGISFLGKIHEFAQNDFGIEKNNLIELDCLSDDDDDDYTIPFN